MTDAFDRAVETETRTRRSRWTRPIWKGWLIHARVYLVINSVLALIWAVGAILSENDNPWFLGSLLGWGVGLLAHYIVVTQVTRQWAPSRAPGSGLDR